MNYTITPIKLGRFESFEKSFFTYATDVGVKLDCPLSVFLVERPGFRLLFDSGPVSPRLAPRKTHRKINEHLSLAEGLQLCGLGPEDIDCVVISHLHWDHSYNLELFPHAPIYVQGTELAYAINPLPCHHVSCNVRNGNGIPQWMAGFENMQAVNGDYRLAEGLQLLALPGHSPGLQGLAVDTGEGRFLLSSDQYPLLENYQCGIPAGIHTDVAAWQRSHEKVLQMQLQVLPAHDDCVFRQPVYGQ